MRPLKLLRACSLALVCGLIVSGCESMMSSTSGYDNRIAQEKSYREFARHQPYVHQPFTLDGYLNKLDVLACEKFNFSHAYLLAMVTESENHRLGLGYCNDVEYFAKNENLTQDAAAQKVKQLVMEEDQGRPSVYENAKRWPRIQAWYEAHKVKSQMDARPKIDDLEYYVYLRQQKGLSVAQAVLKQSPLFDVDYQKLLSVRYPTDQKKKAVARPLAEVKLEVYRSALSLLSSEGDSRPIVSSSELQSCLSWMKIGYFNEQSKKQSNQIDKERNDAMNAQFNRIGSILDDVNRCECFESEQNRRIGLAKSYNENNFKK